MGIYINPDSMSKEDFLTKYGRPVGRADILVYSGEDLKVCLVDNGPFTAAAILYNEREVMDFTSPSDFRPKRYFLVKLEDLRACDSAAASCF